MKDGYIYFSSSKSLGDSLDGYPLGSLRVKYSYCKAGLVSLISQSKNKTFQPFRIDEY